MTGKHWTDGHDRTREAVEAGDRLLIVASLSPLSVAVGDTVTAESVQGQIVTFIAHDGTRRNWTRKCFKILQKAVVVRE